MDHHFIITCGTSQLGEAALEALAFRNRRPYQELRKNGEGRTTRDFRRFPPAQAQLQAESSFNPFLATLEGKCSLNTAPGYVGKGNNPMGAELSTMARLFQRQEWNPQKDDITLLASETNSGVWCAAMVREMLKAWGVPGEKITPIAVEQLKESPGSPEDAAINLAKEVMQAYKPGRQNIIVMTGGFKSIIPVVTVVALVYGMRLVYLFEDAPDVQWIDLRYADAESPPGASPSRWNTLPEAIGDFFKSLNPKKTSQPGTLSTFVRLIIDTWLGKIKPPDSIK